MMTTFNIDMKTNGELKIGFSKSEPAQNDQLVKDAEQRIDFMIANQMITGGDIIKINGPASLPVAMVLAHKLGHLYQAVAFYYPKQSK
jgi:CRISPR-associated protein Csx3